MAVLERGGCIRERWLYVRNVAMLERSGDIREMSVLESFQIALSDTVLHYTLLNFVAMYLIL